MSLTTTGVRLHNQSALGLARMPYGAPQSNTAVHTVHSTRGLADEMSPTTTTVPTAATDALLASPCRRQHEAAAVIPWPRMDKGCRRAKCRQAAVLQALTRFGKVLCCLPIIYRKLSAFKPQEIPVYRAWSLSTLPLQ